MAAATIFVDEVVTGRLPPVCVKTGVPADTWVKDRPQVGSLGAAWVLVFFGPLGWLILAAIAAAGRESLTVVLPYSQAMIDELRRLRRQRNACGLGVVALLLLFVLPTQWALTWPGTGTIALVAMFALLVFTGALQYRLEIRGVGVSIDASRRWVTLRGVSDTFAAQVRASQQRSHDRTNPVDDSEQWGR